MKFYVNIIDIDDNSLIGQCVVKNLHGDENYE